MPFQAHDVKAIILEKDRENEMLKEHLKSLQEQCTAYESRQEEIILSKDGENDLLREQVKSLQQQCASYESQQEENMRVCCPVLNLCHVVVLRFC